ALCVEQPHRPQPILPPRDAQQMADAGGRAARHAAVCTDALEDENAMIVLTANLLIVFAFAYIARRAGELRAGGSNAAAARPDVLMAAFAAMSLVLVSGLRNTIGDTYFY